jgi:AP endonuclease-2
MRLCVVCFNINGIRSYKKPLGLFLDHTDILCIQETKVNSLSDTIDLPNYHSYYSLPRLRRKVGYSGVATFVRHDSPFQVTKTMTDVEFLQDKALDKEGRVLVSFHSNSLIVVNVYFVNKTLPRYEFRRLFFVRLIEQVEALAKDNPTSLLVLCGDFNIASATIDHCDYSSAVREEIGGDNSQTKLFYQEDPVRRQLNLLFLQGNLLDTFRQIYPNLREAYTCWNTKVSARDGNYGTRIDLITVVKNEAVYELKSADIMAHVMGSDHCPVRSVFETSCQNEEIIKAQETEESVQSKKKRKLQTSLKNFLKLDNQQSSKAEVSENTPDYPDEGPRKKSKTSRITTFFETIPSNELEINKEEESPVQKEDIKLSGSTTNWSDIFKKRANVPLCHGHKEPCKLLKVGKKGPNQGRYFYMCARPVGNDPTVNQCSHFQWANPTKSRFKK